MMIPTRPRLKVEHTHTDNERDKNLYHQLYIDIVTKRITHTVAFSVCYAAIHVFDDAIFYHSLNSHRQ